MHLMRIVKQHYLNHWLFLVFGSIALIATTWITITIPQYSKTILNTIADLTVSESHGRLAMIIIVLGLTQIMVRSLSRVLLFWPARKAETSIKSFYFSRFLHLPQTFFDQYGKGDLISRLANDVGQLRGFLGFGVLQLINFTALAAIAMTQMLKTNITLTLLCLIPLVLMAIITKFAMPRLHILSKKQQETLSALTNRVTEGFYHVHTLQVTGTTNTMAKLVDNQNQALYQINMKLVMFRMLLFPLLSLLSGLSYLIVLAYGGKLILENALTIGDIMAFNVYIGLLSFPLTAIGILVASFQRAKVASERLYELEETEVEKPLIEKSEIRNLNSKPLKLEIKSLTFKYNEKDDPAIKDLSLRLDEGEKLGITGVVGSGKTTLLNLISRIYNPPVGSIYINDVDVCSLETSDLRKNLSYAQQTPQLFSDSLSDNLKFGDQFDQEELEEYCQKADILEDIREFSEQFDTVIGEKGIRLSGGQKQRLALARTLLRNTKLLMLDDVLSAVDHRTERKIISVIEDLKATTIISSHRASVLSKCDKILLLGKGKVIAFGKSEEVLSTHKEHFLGRK